ncbi:hypothetical protein FH972_017241 [Carpinus fangiana]|uniref:Uncharacterized protein n=1 Tax=Carpinus fangiana TaxID=176857 RepID=A0A5N6RID5_9ROSI|nr:hypothetical protein FH972_017241 [Carpinus fangiana]
MAHNAAETDDDDGPFFDLEFAVPDEEDDAEGGDNETQNREQEGANCENESDEEEDEEEREFNFTLSSGSNNDRANPNLSLSPSDDLFFKGRLVPIEPSSLVFNPSEPNSKQQPQLFPVLLLKSATKFRVSMLGLHSGFLFGLGERLLSNLHLVALNLAADFPLKGTFKLQLITGLKCPQPFRDPTSPLGPE